jgi:hypothetical protein
VDAPERTDQVAADSPALDTQDPQGQGPVQAQGVDPEMRARADAYDAQVRAQSPQGPGVDPEMRARAAAYDAQVQGQQNAQLLDMFKIASKSDHELVGKAQQLAQQTGVDPGVAERNPDIVRQVMQQRQFELWTQLKDYPIARAQLLNPEFAKLASDQYNNLSWHENILAQFQVGSYQQELASLEDHKFRDPLVASRDGTERKIAWFKQKLALISPKETGFLSTTAKSAGGLAEPLARSLALGAVTGGVGAPLSLFESFDHPAEAYQRMIDAGASPEVAHNWAELSAGANAAYMTIGGGVVSKMVKGIVGRLIGSEVSAAMAKQTTGRGAVDFAKTYLKELATMGAVTGGAAASDLVFADIARGMTPGQTRPSMFSTPRGREEAASAVLDAAIQGVEGVSILGLLHPTAAFLGDLGKARRALQTEQTILTLSQAASESKVLDRNPQAYAGSVQEMAGKADAGTTYIEGTQLARVLQQAAVDSGRPAEGGTATSTPEMRTFAERLPEAAQQLQEVLAAGTGGDVVIPTGKLLAALGKTPILERLAEHMRFDPEADSAFEARLSVEGAKEMVTELGQKLTERVKNDQAFSESMARDRANVEQQLLAAGRTRQEARDAAALVSTHGALMAERLGITPEEFRAKFPLRIESGLQSGGEANRLSQGANAAGGERLRVVAGAAAERSYGVAREGSSSVLGVHFSQGPRTSLSTEFYGRGLRGGESSRVAGDEQLSKRTYFYLDTGSGIRPEAGVGPHAHVVRPDNVYDASKDPLGIVEKWRASIEKGENLGPNDLEHAILKAGFDGYSVPSTPAMPDQGMAVLIGSKHTEIPVAPLKQPEPQTQLQQAATIRAGKETLKAYGLDPGKSYTTRQVAAALEARQRAKYGAVDRKDQSPATATRLAKWMAKEVAFEAGRPDSAVGWYSVKFQQALDKMAEKFPELKSDPAARDVMTALIAITSDGNKVLPNFQMAADIYSRFRKGGTGEGKFTLGIGHSRIASIRGNLELLQQLYDNKSPEEVRDYLLQEASVSELKKLAAANGIELNSGFQIHIKLPMAAIAFGPKLGSFYANLMGSSGYLTMDRWWSRTFNRYRGQLLTQATASGIERVRQLLGKPELSDDEVLAETPALRKSYEAKSFKNGTPLEVAANTVWRDAFHELEDAPFSSTDRTFMLDTVAKAQKLLAKDGLNLSVADIQAALWYFEKRLYGELGARGSGDINYAEAAQRIVGEGTGGASGSAGTEPAGPVQVGEGPTGNGEAAAGPVPAPGEEAFNPGQLQQAGSGPPRGGYDVARFAVLLHKDADASTVFHELGHYFMHTMLDAAELPTATEQMRGDAGEMLKWLGVKDLTTWRAMSLEEQQPLHEQFTYAWERYGFEGKSPSPALKGVFQRFGKFIRDVYRHVITGINDVYRREFGRDLPVLTPEVRAVFDRMLASEDEVRRRDAERRGGPLFESPEEAAKFGVTPEEYKQLVEGHQQAVDDAVDENVRANLRTMQWERGARSGLLKELQAQHDEARARIEEQVRAEAEQEPVYRAEQFIRHGQVAGDDGAMHPAKLDTELVGSRFRPEELQGLTRKGGVDPEALAPQFGFESGDALIGALRTRRPLEEVIKERTDQRMVDEHSDLADPAVREATVEEAIHNQARAKFIARELGLVDKVMREARNEASSARTAVQRLFARPGRQLISAARMAAEQMLASKTLGEINPILFSRAEERAAKAASAALKKGDLEGVMEAKRQQLLQNQLAAQALKAQAEVRASVKDNQKFTGGDIKLSKSRTLDYVVIGRELMRRAGMLSEGLDARTQDALSKIAEYNPGFYETTVAPMLDAVAVRPLKEMTLEQFRRMGETLDSLWNTASKDKKAEILGAKATVDQGVAMLMERMQAIGIPKVVPTEASAPTRFDRLRVGLQEIRGNLRRAESWADAMDGAGAGAGPFKSIFTRPVHEALDKSRAASTPYLRRYLEILEGLKLNEARGTIDATKELGYVFGKGNGGLGLMELFGALLHAGNSDDPGSNLWKNAAARGWGDVDPQTKAVDLTKKWDPFIRRMWAEKILTKEHYDAAQRVWDLMEEIKPTLQKAHHDEFGRYFKEVEATPLQTPWGEYPGGYVPAKGDPFDPAARPMSTVATAQQEFQQSLPATNKGMTITRIQGAYRKLSLDARLITNHIEDSLRFAYLQPVLSDINKFLRRKEFVDTLSRIDPTAKDTILLPFLDRAASQNVTKRSGYALLDSVMSKMKSRTGMGTLFLNLADTALRSVGFLQSALRASPRNMLLALKEYVTARPKAMAEGIAEASPFMTEKLTQQMANAKRGVNELLTKPSIFKSAQEFASKHYYFLQHAFHNLLDMTTWRAAYNDALEAGQLHPEAVMRADEAVRAAQGSHNPEDVAGYEVGTPLYRTFIQYSTHFNAMANLVGTEAVKGRAALAVGLGFMAPALVSGAILRTASGSWKKSDDDTTLKILSRWFFMDQLRYGTTFLPILGPAIKVAVENLTGDNHADSFLNNPAFSMAEAAVLGTGAALKNAFSDDQELTGKNVKDILALMTQITGLPVSGLGRPISYMRDMARGAVRPSSTLDKVRGLITGKASQGTR